MTPSRPTTMPKPVKAWAYTKHGKIIPEMIEKKGWKKWKPFVRQGYIDAGFDCIRVTITPDE